MVPSPSIAPKPAAPTPVTRPVEPPHRRRLGFILFLVVCSGLGLAYWVHNRAVATNPATAAPAFRTAAVVRGAFDNALRVTGTTGAEHYVSLITPQLRGSRNGPRTTRVYTASMAGISDGGGKVQSNANGTVPAGSAAGGGSSSSDPNASGTVSSTSSASTGASTSGSSLNSALRSATSRVSSRTSSRTSSAISSSPGSAASATLGSDGLGSTSSSLSGGSNGPGAIGSSRGGGGGGGGGRGGSEFNIVLQSTAKPGGMVRKGDVVAEFDRQFMVNRLDDNRALLAQTESAVAKLKAELDVNRKAHDQKIAVAASELDKARLDMKTTPVLSAIESERVKLALEEAEANLKQLRAEVKPFDAGLNAQYRDASLDLEQSKIEFRRFEANADRMVLKAPIDGLIVMQTTFRGGEMAQIQAGDQLYPGMMFMQIVDPRSMVINASVNQVDVEQVRVGMKAKVRFDAYPDLVLPAHVYSLGAITRPGGYRASFVKEIPIKLKLDAMDPRVIPDLSVSADVELETQPDQTMVARSSIFRDSEGKPFVYVRDGDSWPSRPVELGSFNHLYAVIRSGLRPGEVVAAERPASAGKT